DLLIALPQVHTKLYRQIIEIRDAQLVLNRYLTPEITRQAREHVSSHAAPASLSEATFTACTLEGARQAKITGKIPSGSGNTISDHGGSDRKSEIRWLCSVAQAHRSPVIQAFTDTLRRSTDNDGEDAPLDLSKKQAR